MAEQLHTYRENCIAGSLNSNCEKFREIFYFDNESGWTSPAQLAGTQAYYYGTKHKNSKNKIKDIYYQFSEEYIQSTDF